MGYTVSVLRFSTTFTTRQRQLTKDRKHSKPLFLFPFMKFLLILATILTASCFADYGVVKTYHYTLRTTTKVCSVDIVILDTGRVTSDSICYNLK